MIDGVEYINKVECPDGCCTYYTDGRMTPMKIHGQMHKKVSSGRERILTYNHGKLTFEKISYDKEEWCSVYDNNGFLSCRVARRDRIIIQNIQYADQITKQAHVYNDAGDLIGTYIRGDKMDKITCNNFEINSENLKQMMKLYSHTHLEDKGGHVTLEAEISGDKLTEAHRFEALNFVCELNQTITI